MSTSRRAPARALMPGRELALALVLATCAAGSQAATVELVSGMAPVPDSFGTSSRPVWSADGRYVAFQSDAPNLVPGQEDVSYSSDVFLHDRVAGTTTLVSHAAGAPTRAAGSFESLGISADGRYVIFSSRSPDLVPGPPDSPPDNNGDSDVFLWDRVTGTTTLVSHAAGSPGTVADGASYAARMNADASFIAFQSQAGNLVASQAEPGPPLATTDVFLWSRPSDTATLVSRRGGTPDIGGNQSSYVAGISADGGVVVFTTFANDLLPNIVDANNDADVYAYQRSTGSLSLISRFASALQGAAGALYGTAAVSADGRYVVFASHSDQLAPVHVDDDPDTPDAFLYDRATGEMRLVSHRHGSPVRGGGVFAAGGIAMSADDRYVAFSSYATNLVPGQTDTNFRPDVFVWDRVTDLLSLASHSRDAVNTAGSGGAGSTGQSVAAEPSFSADGRFLAFSSMAVDLVPGQTDRPDTADVFLYDQASRNVNLVSRTGAPASTAGAAGNGHSFSPVLSADGSVVAFLSQATDLGEGQTDPYGFADLFLHRRSSGETTSPSRRDLGLPPPLTSPYPSTLGGLSADGRSAVFQDGTRVFLRDTPANTTTRLSPPIPAPYLREHSWNPLLSADGRVAAFLSKPFGAVAVPPQDFIDGLYLYDRAAGTFTLVNRGFGPGPTDGSASSFALSADARYVAYECTRCALVPGHPAAGPIPILREIFLYDRLTGLNTLVSHASSSPTARPDDWSYVPAISADGRYVVFWSEATNLVPGQIDAPRTLDLFVFDRVTGGIGIVTHVPGSPTTAGGLSSLPPALLPADLSADGRFIAFQSYLPNLVPGQVDDDDSLDVFLHDQFADTAHTTVLVSHAAASPVTAGSAPSLSSGLDDKVSITPDGRLLVYASPAVDLVAGAADTNNARDVFLYDRLTGVNSLVSHAGGAPLEAADGGSELPRISADGSHIAFLSASTDLIPGQTAVSDPSNLHVRDRSTGTTVLVAPVYRAPGPFNPFPPGGDESFPIPPHLSADGQRIAFVTDIPLVPGDYNGTADVYLWNQDGFSAVPSCRLLDTRRRAERPALTSNVPRTVNVHGSCGVPATAKEIVVNVTVFNPSGKGNLRFYPGTATAATPSSILRFERGTTRTETFTLPLGPDGKLTILPFVAGRGTVHVAVEVTGYSE